MNKMERPTFVQAIKRVEAEVDNRFEQRSENERALYAMRDEVDALRSLAATLVMVFGPFPMIGFK